MWFILLIVKIAVAEDLRYEREVVDQVKYSPSLKAALSYAPSYSNYPTRNFEGHSFEVPWRDIQTNGQYVEPDKCPQLETLQSILVLLKRLLNQDDNLNYVQPDKGIQILQSLKEHLERSGSDLSAIDNHRKLKEIINKMDKAVVVENNALRHGLNHRNHMNRIHANFEFKYNIPSVTTGGCQEALTSLIETVQNIQLQMSRYCHQSRKCEWSSESRPLDAQGRDKSNIVNSILGLNRQTSSKITPSNPFVYDIPKSINNLGNPNNPVLSQNVLNDYLDTYRQSQFDSNNDQFITTNNFNTDVNNFFDNNGQSIDAYNNVYFNKETSPLNMKYAEKSNVLNNILSFQHPIHTDGQNIDNIQNPFTILGTPQRDVFQWGSNDYLNVHAHPESYSNKQFLASVLQKDNDHKGESYNYKHLNTLDTIDLNTPINKFKHFREMNDAFPLVQTPYINRFVSTTYNNEPSNNSHLYKYSQLLNNKSSSTAAINQNKYNMKELVQYNNNFNNLPILRPRKTTNFAPENIIPTNFDNYSGKYQNQNLKQTLDPTVYSSLNTKQNPLTYINLNRQNSFNYGAQRADAVIHRNFGSNLHAPTNLVDYPKHDIYGNKLFDLHRLASVSNLVKLNSVADNAGVVELTYELKRPQSISYNPYYYLKFRMPIGDFVSKITALSKNPLLRSNPMKVHEELLSVSNLAEAPPDLKYGDRDEVYKLILNNGAALINAKIIGTNDLSANQHLKTIQNLNVNLNTNDILSLFENDNTYNPTPSTNSDISIYRPESNPYDEASVAYENVDS